MPKPVKWYLVGIITLSIALVILASIPRHPMVDTVTMTPFVVIRVNDGFPAFWGWVPDHKVPWKSIKPRKGWTHDVCMAFRYPDPWTAYAEAIKRMGIAVTFNQTTNQEATIDRQS